MGLINIADVPLPTDEQLEAWEKYEAGKQKLYNAGLSDFEYMQAIKELARECGV